MAKVKREVLEACMTCPLCNRLLKEATTISLCLHTFCRKCIYDRLSDDEVDSCPVCSIDLGCLPVEKLRPDHSLQDIRTKVFPFKRRKIHPPKVMPSITLTAKRKERSLSSLVVSTPKVSIQTGFIGKRSKASARKAAGLRACSFSVDESNKNEDSAEDNSTSSSSPLSPCKTVPNKRVDSSVAEPSKEYMAKIDMEDDVEIIECKADLWKPLNCLVEAANRTKSSKSNLQGPSLTKSEPPNDYEPHSSETKCRFESNSGHDNDVYLPKNKNKEHGQGVKFQGHKNGTNSLPMSVKRRRLTAARKRAAMSEGLRASAQAIVDAGAKSHRRNNSIWFTLVASNEQKGDAPLPQISSCYLRIKDAKMPVSFIQKYLVKKLDLNNEAEVEIMCRGEPVLPTLQLYNLVDLWFRTVSNTKKVTASVGASAKEFVMVLSYSRKVQSS